LFVCIKQIPDVDLYEEAHFHVGETVTAVQKARLVCVFVSVRERMGVQYIFHTLRICKPHSLSHKSERQVEGGVESVIYATIGGGMGAMQPLVKERDATLLQRLELLLRGAAGDGP
jgi:hypothetical protein